MADRYPEITYIATLGNTYVVVGNDTWYQEILEVVLSKRPQLRYLHLLGIGVPLIGHDPMVELGSPYIVRRAVSTSQSRAVGCLHFRQHQEAGMKHIVGVN